MVSGRRLCKIISQHIDWFSVQGCPGWKEVWRMYKMADAVRNSCPKIGAGVQKSSIELRHDQGLSLLN